MRMLADLLGRDENQVRVITPDVGGGFGPKLVFYQEEAVVALAALLLRRPVKWIEDRCEHFISLPPRSATRYWDVEIAVAPDGKIRGFRGTLIHDHGAYTARGVNVPYGSGAALPLAYEIPAYRLDIKLALTNKVPVTPVRGAGQPQGVFAMERLLDRAALALGIDRAEMWRRNLVPAEKMPYAHTAQDARRHAGRARQRRLSGLPAHGGSRAPAGPNFVRRQDAARRAGRQHRHRHRATMWKAPAAGRSSP